MNSGEGGGEVRAGEGKVGLWEVNSGEGGVKMLETEFFFLSLDSHFL